jgi:hypothetical protein
MWGRRCFGLGVERHGLSLHRVEKERYSKLLGDVFLL